MKKQNKYYYCKVIQQNYGFGWDDNSEYETNSNFLCIDKETKDLFIHDLKEYRLTGYNTRTINRKELNKNTNL
jgi:hypothetical protein